MITLDCEQGTPEWLAARVGIPTASNFGSIITPTGLQSTGRKDYLRQLAGEWMIGKPDPDAFTGSYWMKRGNELEAAARAYYQFMYDEPVIQIGFAYKDALRQFGCSPDGLIGDDGCWENKTPKLTTHVGYLEKGVMPGIYKPQTQGVMWICDRQWCDFMSFHPDTEPLIVRVMRDDDYISKMSEQMKLFLADLRLLKNKMEGFKL